MVQKGSVWRPHSLHTAEATIEIQSGSSAGRREFLVALPGSICPNERGAHSRLAAAPGRVASHSRRAAIPLYQATRAITCLTFRSVARPCHARFRGGRCGGDPWMAWKGSIVETSSVQLWLGCAGSWSRRIETARTRLFLEVRVCGVAVPGVGESYSDRRATDGRILAAVQPGPAAMRLATSSPPPTMASTGTGGTTGPAATPS
jgi:hypothetical protein